MRKCCHYNVIKGAVQSYCGEKFSDKLSVARWKKGKNDDGNSTSVSVAPKNSHKSLEVTETMTRPPVVVLPPTHQQLSRENQLSHKSTAWDSLTTEVFFEKRKILDKENY